MSINKKSIVVLVLTLGMIFSLLIFSKMSLNTKSISKTQEVKTPQNSQKSSWATNGIAICTENESQFEPQICSDGIGGAIITWYDRRSGTADIYTQKINSSGIVQWENNGTAISTAIGNQYYPQICSDGVGGAIITWQDRRGGFYDIYVQRINSSGIIQWENNGTAISTATGSQYHPQICNDGVGGAIITWEDRRGASYDIYVQRINSSGIVQWTADGVPICTINNDQRQPQICSDGVGGAIITWYDNRSGSNDIYIQKINSNGITQWIPNGTAICTAGEGQIGSQIYSDGAGGAIVVWMDKRNGINYDIYTQRIDINGNTQWTPNGTAICTAGQDQFAPRMCSDGVGGAIFIWKDARSSDGSFYQIYIQRVDITGDVQWIFNGVLICTASYHQNEPQICSDGTGGAIVTWYDTRSEAIGDNYVQRIDAKGNIQWTTSGVPICTAGGRQLRPQICSDGAGGAIITWMDERNGLSTDIYAQRVETIQLINVEITHQSFSTDMFNITIFVYYKNEIGIDSATINAWWNDMDISTDTQNHGGGYYLISLDPIFVVPGENPILLNMTISADGYEDKYFETYLAATELTTKKTEFPIPGYNIILITCLISVMILVSIIILHKKK